MFDEPHWKSSSNQRKSRRDAVRIGADLLISAGPRFKVSVLDLSQTGFRAETGNHIERGSKVYLTIPSFQSLSARVAWNERDCYGCEFTHPLHQSIFEHIARKYPMLVE
ncbi:MAG: PilZ domain-containing protein [Sphingomonadaceae bacterium]|nr:PilZ domain-containing protein [Sphingomonadaceae bacterium]